MDQQLPIDLRPESLLPDVTGVGTPTPEQPAAADLPLTSAEAKKAKPSFPPPAPVPTQLGPSEIRFDFNFGARLSLPPGEWKSRLTDLDTGNTLFQSDKGGVFIQSSKRFYVRFGIEVRDSSGELVLSHEFAARDRDVLITFPVGTLGDTLGWMPYAARFQVQHGCRLTCAMAGRLCELFRDAYPAIAFVTHEEVNPEQFYATYNLGLFFDDAAFEWQPTDFRHVGLHRTAGYILGVDPTEESPRLNLPDSGRPIPEPYVCIAVQASTHAKKWLNPHGWLELVRMLKERGYRVICIDRERSHGTGLYWSHIPNGAEDETGERPLAERARWLKHAACFVGVSSGLAWLAWSVRCPVAMISGFTHPNNEFDTPGRIINWHVCNSCWNDVRHRFDHNDYLWCPRHKGTHRQFECTLLITADQVKQAVGRLLPASPSIA